MNPVSGDSADENGIKMHHEIYGEIETVDIGPAMMVRYSVLYRVTR